MALVIDELNIKIVSASLIIFGVIGIYISKYDDKKDEYAILGSEIKKLFNELKSLYHSVKAKSDDTNFDEDISKMKEIEDKFYLITIPKQILFSDWYAHYKFFWQWATHIKWLESELKLTFWENKIPLSFLVFIGVVLLIFIGSFIRSFL